MAWSKINTALTVIVTVAAVAGATINRVTVANLIEATVTVAAIIAAKPKYTSYMDPTIMTNHQERNTIPTKVGNISTNHQERNTIPTAQTKKRYSFFYNQ